MADNQRPDDVQEWMDNWEVFLQGKMFRVVEASLLDYIKELEAGNCQVQDGLDTADQARDRLVDLTLAHKTQRKHELATRAVMSTVEAFASALSEDEQTKFLQELQRHVNFRA